MSDPSRRNILFLSTSAAASALLPGCDRLVLPGEEFLTEIPPISTWETFYRYSYSGRPEIDLDTWSCVIEDRGSEVASFDVAYLDTLTPVAFEHTLQCIGSGPRLQNIDNAVFGGLPLSEVLADLGVTIDSSIVEFAFEGVDGYHDSFPIEDLDKPVWLVWEMNGEPIRAGHGFPCRLLVPGRYGIKNVKWPSAFRLVDEPYIGYWQEQNWEKDGTYKANAFIKSPPNLATVMRNEPLVLLGTAYAGEDPIERVEITFDDGDSWEDCVIDYGPGPNIWTLWRFDWTPTRNGRQRIRTRVTTEAGVVSNPDPSGTNRLNGYDGGMEIEVAVQ
ncbi:MAG: molybdopterin-dependent oxidoreductase [Proteobacteria bacterium]|nr:molybdopterin-dependent oxidoreductase [Pseudomonadota bacterium]